MSMLRQDLILRSQFQSSRRCCYRLLVVLHRPKINRPSGGPSVWLRFSPPGSSDNTSRTPSPLIMEEERIKHRLFGCPLSAPVPARGCARQSPPTAGALRVTFDESILLGAEAALSKPHLQRSLPKRDLPFPSIVPSATTAQEASATAYTDGLARVSVSSKRIFKETNSDI